MARVLQGVYVTARRSRLAALKLLFYFFLFALRSCFDCDLFIIFLEILFAPHTPFNANNPVHIYIHLNRRYKYLNCFCVARCCGRCSVFIFAYFRLNNDQPA